MYNLPTLIFIMVLTVNAKLKLKNIEAYLTKLIYNIIWFFFWIITSTSNNIRQYIKNITIKYSFFEELYLFNIKNKNRYKF